MALPPRLRRSATLNSLIGTEHRPRRRTIGHSATLSDPLGVDRTVWTRELTEDGRVFFYNRGTGAAQWHVPNELYKPRCLNAQLVFNDLQKMPGSARALFGVDCVTELPRSKKKMAASICSVLFNDSAEEVTGGRLVKQAAEPLPYETVLELTCISARGLRDADFMPGVDKSDPYCNVEIVGKPQSTFKTRVIDNCLDPVWNYAGFLIDYEKGDSVALSVWNKNDDQLTNAKQRNHDNRGMIVNEGDDLLGRILLTQEELHTPGKQEFRLEEAGKDIEAYISINVKVLDAWPGLLGQPVSESVTRLREAHPTLDIRPLEEPDHGSRVVSWDALHAREGYAGNFIGAIEESLANLTAGDEIQVGSKRFTYSHRGPPKQHPKTHQTIRYMFFKEDITGTIRDGSVWKKVPPEIAVPGCFETRVCVYFWPGTHVVSRIPFIG